MSGNVFPLGEVHHARGYHDGVVGVWRDIVAAGFTGGVCLVLGALGLRSEWSWTRWVPIIVNTYIDKRFVGDVSAVSADNHHIEPVAVG